MYFPCFCILEMKYMTLLQRDRENIELGREEGREEGRNRMVSLTKILLSKNRTEELNRALEDPDFRNRLFEEYDIFLRVKSSIIKNNSSIWIYGIFKLAHLRKIQTPRKELFHV